MAEAKKAIEVEVEEVVVPVTRSQRRLNDEDPRTVNERMRNHKLPSLND